jgi:hypothetical protein
VLFEFADALSDAVGVKQGVDAHCSPLAGIE